LNDMEGREPPWVERPIVTKEFSYQPTRYGSLVGQCLFDESTEEPTLPSHDNIISTIHTHLFENIDSAQPELVEEAFREANL